MISALGRSKAVLLVLLILLLVSVAQLQLGRMSWLRNTSADDPMSGAPEPPPAVAESVKDTSPIPKKLKAQTSSGDHEIYKGGLQTSEKNRTAALRWRPPPASFMPLPPVRSYNSDWDSGRPQGAIGGAALERFLGDDRGSVDLQKADTVKEMMRHAWKGYRTYAWGFDELRTTSKVGHNWYDKNSMLSTPVDALDTLWIMGLKEEFNEARDLVLDKLELIDRNVNLFETTIRVIGGLLSAYDLSGDQRFVLRCVKLLDGLLGAFKTPNGLPVNNYNPFKGFSTAPVNEHIFLSEAGSLQLEFQYLSDVTGDPIYAELAILVIEQMNTFEFKQPGLYQLHLSTGQLGFVNGEYSLGAASDSHYEYLLKLWLSTGEERYRQFYITSAHALVESVVAKSPSGHLYPSVVSGESHSNTLEHLSCFSGGMFALGGHATRRGRWARHVDVGAEITRSCYEAYNNTASGLGPEIASSQTLLPYGNPQYKLRPETVESIFYLWRLTHDQKYRDWGWNIVNSLNKHCRDEVGFHGIINVDVVAAETATKRPSADKVSSEDDPEQTPILRKRQHHDDTNIQSSYFLAETLKYLYLLFMDDDTIPLEQYVFSTEAHVLSVRGHGRRKDEGDWAALPLQPSSFKHRKIGELEQHNT